MLSIKKIENDSNDKYSYLVGGVYITLSPRLMDIESSINMEYLVKSFDTPIVIINKVNSTFDYYGEGQVALNINYKGYDYWGAFVTTGKKLYDFHILWDGEISVTITDNAGESNSVDYSRECIVIGDSINVDDVITSTLSSAVEFYGGSYRVIDVNNLDVVTTKHEWVNVGVGMFAEALDTISSNSILRNNSFYELNEECTKLIIYHVETGIVIKKDVIYPDGINDSMLDVEEILAEIGIKM